MRVSVKSRSGRDLGEFSFDATTTVAAFKREFHRKSARARDRPSSLSPRPALSTEPAHAARRAQTASTRPSASTSQWARARTAGV
jgi:hypothetical protein